MTTPNITMTPIESSNIAATGYDADTRTLAVQFKNGGLYHYHDVPAEIAGGFGEAESRGQFFQNAIRGQFKHTKIPADE
jgi:KTSC domain-containing protein